MLKEINWTHTRSKCAILLEVIEKSKGTEQKSRGLNPPCLFLLLLLHQHHQPCPRRFQEEDPSCESYCLDDKSKAFTATT